MAIRLQGTAIDLAVWVPPTRNRIDRHGEPAIEKLPTQRSRYMLNPAGHGVWVSLHTGSGNRNPNDPFALRKLDEKMRLGFLPFDRCPQGLDEAYKRHLPENVPDRASCGTGIDPAKPISNDNPCKCIREAETVRTKAHGKRNAENESRYRSREEREREARDRHIEALERQNTALTDKKKP